MGGGFVFEPSFQNVLQDVFPVRTDILKYFVYKYPVKKYNNYCGDDFAFVFHFNTLFAPRIESAIFVFSDRLKTHDLLFR